MKYDVAIVGGALSGAAAAILLLRKDPQLRVVILEKSTAFSRRVGEATVEVSGYFLGRVLGLTQHLNDSHLVKQGMRFWFSNAETQSLDQSSEFGGRFLSRVPAYQVDRAVLDEEILRRAAKMGAEVIRPASVTSITLNPGADQSLTIQRSNDSTVQPLTLTARWVIDASGVAALLARKKGWWRSNDEHPTTAVWARWKNVKDWDGLELAERFPDWARVCFGIRGTATNHLTGDGWWAWCIPLKGGDVSVGVVFDQRLVTFPEGGSLGERLKSFLCAHPVGKELLADATPIEGDVHWRKNLAYYSTTFAGDGFALVGDAAGFIDPLYSPGMDWISYTVTTTVDLILSSLNPNPNLNRAVQPLNDSTHSTFDIRHSSFPTLLAAHNRDLNASYHRWFGALYKDKYSYLGEYDLMRLAFLLDLGLYYFGVVSQPFKCGPDAFKIPMFASPLAVPFFHFMRFYNQRFAKIAQARRERHNLGRTNCGRRFMFGGYTFAPGSSRHLFKAISRWWWLELIEGWRTWFKPSPIRRVESASTPELPAPAVQPAHTS